MKPSHEQLLYLRRQLDKRRKVSERWEVVREFVEEVTSIVFADFYYDEGSRGYYVAGSSLIRGRCFEVRFIWFPDAREYQSALVWRTDVELMEEGDRFNQSVMVRWKTNTEGMLDLTVALIDSEEIEG